MKTLLLLSIVAAAIASPVAFAESKAEHRDQSRLHDRTVADRNARDNAARADREKRERDFENKVREREAKADARDKASKH